MYVTWWFVLLGGMACAMIWAPAAAEKVRRLKEETGGPAYEPLTLDM
jgi:hypothetical protein